MSAGLSFTTSARRISLMPQRQKGNVFLQPLVGFYPRKLGILSLMEFLSLLWPPGRWAWGPTKEWGSRKVGEISTFVQLWPPWVSEPWTVHLCTSIRQAQGRMENSWAQGCWVHLLLLWFPPRGAGSALSSGSSQDYRAMNRPWARVTVEDRRKVSLQSPDR